MNRYIAVHNFFRALVLATVVALPGGIIAAPAARAADAPSNKLESINVQPLSGQRLELQLNLSGPAPTPLSFTQTMIAGSIVLLGISRFCGRRPSSVEMRMVPLLGVNFVALQMRLSTTCSIF